MVEIFGFEGYNCKYCQNAKRLCESRKIPYIYIPVNDGVDENGRPVKIDSIIADIQDRAGVEVLPPCRRFSIMVIILVALMSSDPL